ncbi:MULTISPECIES: hypothetical protein [unclassified Eikenella]|nr:MULTISPECIES: hypothetical protein [unclassified Eikenella]
MNTCPIYPAPYKGRRDGARYRPGIAAARLHQDLRHGPGPAGGTA